MSDEVLTAITLTLFAAAVLVAVFVIFRKDSSIVWSFSGNNLRSHFLAEPDEFISAPIECQIPQALYDRLSDDLDNF